MLARAQGVSNTPYNPYGGELVAGVNPQQTQGIANINNYANYAQPYLGTALQYAQNAAQPITQQQIQQYMSPYTQNVVQATQNQFNNQNAQAQEGLKANAIRQGALGGNRVGIASAELSNQQNLAQAPVIANLMNQGYTTGLNTALTEQQAMASGAANLGGLGIAGQNAGLTGANAQIGAGTLQQQTQQQQDLANYQQFMQQQAYPFQTAQWLAGLGTGVGSQMGGTNTTVGPAPNSLNSWLGLGAAGVGAVGQAGGWAALGSMLSRGGVAGRAEGGGVAGPDTMPESIDTLMEQQKQLLDGYRSTQMFPNGTPELNTPPGMERTETPAGIFHHDPGQVGSDQVQDLSSQGRENELLGLGPVEKEKVLALIQKGEVPLAIVERAPNGTEVRAAVGTHSTVAQQFAAMLRNKSPGNTLKIEDLRQALAQRGARSAPNDMGVAGRDVGGPVSIPSAMGIAGMPWSGAQGWVPGANFPTKPFSVATPKPAAQTPIFDAAKMGKDLGTMASSIKAGFNAPASNNNTPGTFDSSGVAPADPGTSDYGTPQYARGGMPVGLAAGGDPDFSDRFDAAYEPTASNLDNTGVSAFAAPQGVAPPPPFAQLDKPPVDATAPAPDLEGGKPQAAAQPPSSLAALQRAIYGQESNFGQNAVTSDRNAHGPMQIIPATFAQFAKPGEDIKKDADNIAVGNRILETYMQKYNGDPARAAVAYFSGPGNVAPPGSPTPWIEDKSDGHKSVSGYVSDVMKRMNGPGDKGVAPDTDVSAQSRGPAGTGESQQGTLDQPKGVSGIDISANSKLWPSLMTAGFGMMASRSPFLGVAVGEGGLHGMNTYSELNKSEAAQKLSQAQMQQKAQQLSMDADKITETGRHNRVSEAIDAAKGNITPLPGYQSPEGHPLGLDHRSGKTIDLVTGKTVDPKTDLKDTRATWKPYQDKVTDAGDPILINPQGQMRNASTGEMLGPGSKIVSAKDTPLEPASLEIRARQLALGDLKSAFSGLGFGAAAAKNKNAVSNMATKILVQDGGMTPQAAAEYLSKQMQSFNAQGVGLSSEARTAGVREANLAIILRATDAAIPAALEASEAVSRTGWVPINQIIQKGQVIASSPELKAFGMANLQLAEHWARAMNPTGVMRESDRDLALHFLNTADSKDTYRVAVMQLKKQIEREKAAVQGFQKSHSAAAPIGQDALTEDKARQELAVGVSKPKSEAAPPAAVTPPPAAAAKPSLPQFLERARTANPGVSDAALTEYYTKKYGTP